MFSFFKQKKREVPIDSFGFLEVDIHSHFLPGIDDGAPDVQASLALIDGFIDLGYKRLVATPHIMGDYFKNTRESIQNAYDKLKEELDEKGYTIPISFAAEYMIDEEFEEKIKTAPLLTLGDNYVLIESMFMGMPPNIKEVLFALETHGYKPILAHPERYHFLDDKLKKLDMFLERGVLLQTNILSFTGYYGPKEKEMAELLLNNDKIDLLGSDMHHLNHLDALKQFNVHKKTAEKLRDTVFKNQVLF